MKKVLRWVSLWPSVILLLLICGEIVFRYPCNHGAGFYCYLYPSCGLIVVSFIYGFRLNGSKIGICFALLCLLLILCSDWFNVYVDYDTWISRGMPDWGHPTFADVIPEAVGNHRKVSVEILAHSHEPYGMVLRPYQSQSELIAKSDDASDFIVDFMVAVRNETVQSIAFPVEHSSFGYTNMTIMISTDRKRVVRLEKRPCIWTKNILECVKVLAGDQVFIPVSLDRRLWENMPEMDVGDKMFVKALLAVDLLSKSNDEENLLCIESNWKELSYRATSTFSPWCTK